MICSFIACDDGTYGKECNSVCGNCINEEPCYHINGTCLNGCAPGYKGDQCSKRVYLIFISM